MIKLAMISIKTAEDSSDTKNLLPNDHIQNTNAFQYRCYEIDNKTHNEQPRRKTKKTTHILIAHNPRLKSEADILDEQDAKTLRPTNRRSSYNENSLRAKTPTIVDDDRRFILATATVGGSVRL